MVLRLFLVMAVGVVVSSCGFFSSTCDALYACEPCQPAFNFTVVPPSGAQAPTVELRGLDAFCFKNPTDTFCTASYEQSLYEFDIVVEGYKPIHVRHELEQVDCGGQCCCCGYKPANLSFTLERL